MLNSREATLLGKLHARHDSHGHEFLEEKFAGIRQEHLDNAGGALACRAMELVLAQVGHCHHTALLAHMHSVRIALVEEPLLHSQHNSGIWSPYSTICCKLKYTKRDAPVV